MEKGIYGEVAQPNEQNLKERLIFGTLPAELIGLTKPIF
jgi:hypothetical protein